MEKLGIDNLKEAVREVVEFSEKVIECTQDGDLNLFDKLKLLGQGAAFAKFVTNARDIKAEYMDLDDQERAELSHLIREEFDYEDDRIESIIEQSFTVGLAIEGLVRTI